VLKEYRSDKIGLILSGGGARAAYQVGVLRGIASILPRETANPFDIISGTSAGALNAAALACHAQRLRTGVRLLEYVWKNIHSDHVYQPQSGNLLGGASTLLLTMMSGKEPGNALSLLDNTPLNELLSRVLKLDKIQRNIDIGLLDALSITASAYSTGESVSFYQSVQGISDWEGPHRIGRRSKITLQHLMASSAIPILFPATKIGDQYYGDGAVRQLAPTSTALHLGADRILAIGVSGNSTKSPLEDPMETAPSLSQIMGHILNSAFVDTLENDLQSLRHMNEILPLVPDKVKEKSGIVTKPIELLEISPSEELNILADQHYDELPKRVSKYVKDSSSGTLLSLILFEQGFCTALWELGVKDALAKSDEIAHFFRS